MLRLQGAARYFVEPEQTGYLDRSLISHTTMTSFRSFREQSLHYIIRDNSDNPSFPINTGQAWVPADFKQDSVWLQVLTPEELDELSSAVDRLQSSGVEMQDVSKDNCPLPLLSNRVGAWRETIQTGAGFVVVRGLPVEAWGEEKSAYAYWALGHQLGIPGAQNPQNELLGHVIDYGEEKDNANVRRYRTSGNIDFHCDIADIVGLMCLQTAKSGGQSRIASSVTVFNEIYKRDPKLALRFFEPFYMDRRGEEKPGEKPYMTISPCVWTEESGLKTFYHSEYFRSASRHETIEIDATAMRALDLYDELCASPEIHLDMWLKPGDMQFISNHTIVHARTEYEDWPEKERRRHLLRLWLSL